MAGLSEESIERKRVFVRLPIKVYKQLLRKYEKPGDSSENEALIRAAEAAVADMELTDADRAFIESERAKNLDHRMMKRQAHKAARIAARKKGGAE